MHRDGAVCLGTGHTTPAKFENAALFRSTIHLIRHENALQTGENLKRWLFVFRVDEKHFENGAFQNNDFTIIMQFPCPSF